MTEISPSDEAREIVARYTEIHGKEVLGDALLAIAALYEQTVSIFREFGVAASHRYDALREVNCLFVDEICVSGVYSHTRRDNITLIVTGSERTTYQGKDEEIFLRYDRASRKIVFDDPESSPLAGCPEALPLLVQALVSHLTWTPPTTI